MAGPDWTRLGASTPTPPPVIPKPAPAVAPQPVQPARRTLDAGEQKAAHAKRVKNATARRAERTALVKKGQGLAIGENPCTSEIDYTDAETQFNMALDKYKREKRRPFPTNREILWVLLGLGYRQVTTPGATDGTLSDGRAEAAEAVG